MTVPSRSGGGSPEGRLEFRAGPAPTASGGPSGLLTVQGSSQAQPSLAYVPATAGEGPMRLVVFLHGAGSSAQDAMDALRAFADDERLLLVAPKSAHSTWDMIAGGYGPDVENIDRLLESVTADYPVLGFTVAGFSDGASYALSLGIANGDLFDSVMAFSPGFHNASVRNGKPRFFFSHGTKDRTLPIERCSRRLVPELERGGYDVTYEEFDGGHFIPDPIKQTAMGWLRAD